jgi:hypothetical protein
MPRRSELLGATHASPIPRDTRDWMLMSFWAHPSACSTWLRVTRHRGSRACRRRSSIASSPPWATTSPTEPGTRATSPRGLDAYDAGLRLVVNQR